MNSTSAPTVERSHNTGVTLSTVAVIIPALNEEDGIVKVLDDLPEVGRVIVVDNGSTDRTAELATQAGATVVTENQRGYGAACLRGLAELDTLIASGEIDADIVGFVDADYSDHPNLFDQIVQPMIDDKADMVLGSRLAGALEPGAMPPQAIWGNRLACFLMRLFWRARYTDLGPMRAIKLDALRKLSMRDQNYGWTVEMQIKAVRQDLRFVEIPVPYRKRIGTSKISGTITGTIKAGYKILLTIFRYGIVG